MIRATFRRFERISRQGDFVLARREGRRRAGTHLTVWTRFRGETPPRAARLGIVVGRKHGIAARRNLFKRRLREAFRLHKDRFARGWDFVVSPRTPGKGKAFPPAYAELLEDFLRLVIP